MYGTNQAIGAQRRHNRDQFNQTKAELIAASDQNYMNAFNDVLEGGLAAASLIDPRLPRKKKPFLNVTSRNC